ncbi:unnamed protein product [Rhizophagus irregularis]|nr:unnamed protein product [Rhizophagus irregularis]
MELDFTDCGDLTIGKEIIEGNFINWTSGNEVIDDYIQDKQLEYDGHGAVFGWIPYSELIDIKEIGDNRLTTAILKNGSLYYSEDEKKWIRESHENVVLRFLCNPHDTENTYEFKKKVKSCLTYNCYGISQNPDTKDYILVYNINYYDHCEKCNNYTSDEFRWCGQCGVNFLKANFINWTSGNEIIDNYIREKQLKYKYREYRNAIFEWIPYSEFIYIEERGDNCLTTAIWKDGPSSYDKYFEKKLTKSSYEKVVLRFLYDLENIVDEFSNKVESYLLDDREHKYGISQNPYTKIFILVFDNHYLNYYCEKCGNKYEVNYNWCKKCQINQLKSKFANWTSGNEKIDEFIQKMQSEINKYDDVIFEWIPYDELIEINEINDGFTTAIWKKGPLSYNIYEKKWIRNSCGKKVSLKYLHNSQDIADALLNMADKLHFEISQNPDTKVYILVFYGDCCEKCGNKYKGYYEGYYKWCKQCQINQLKDNFISWTSGNEKIDDFIQKMQLKICKYYDVIFEWISYKELIGINEINKDDGFTAAIWKKGPLLYNIYEKKLERRSEEVVLRFLYDLQNINEEFLNKVESYLANRLVFGISQNPDTKVYILVFNNSTNYCIKCNNKHEIRHFSPSIIKWCQQCQINQLKSNFTNWASGNEKIDEFIQKSQLKINDYNDTVFEWIPYNELVDIEQIADNCLTAAIWKNGPLCYSNSYSKYRRKLNEKVLLKYFNNNIFLNEITYLVKESYGVTLNPNTNDFILVLQSKYYCENCKKRYNNEFEIDNKSCVLCQINHENKKINDLIQEIKLSIDYNSNEFNLIFEWIPYDQFDNIKEIGKGGFSTVYSAIWKNGLLYYDNTKQWKRKPNTKVALKCLHNSQNSLDEFINEVKAYPRQKINNILKIYGISRYPTTKEYIMVLEYAEGGNFNNYFNKNYENFNWFNGLKILTNIIEGLSKIHQNQMVHRDFHIGNILFIDNNYNACISDLGLSKKIDDINETSIYGVMPYVAPEVLRGKPYTRAADIYSFGMIMYVIATGRQPYTDCAHDEILAFSICDGIRPEINEKIAPKCYIDLMKRCWDSSPTNRPNSIEIKEIIELFCNSLDQEFKKKELQHYKIEEQFKETQDSRKENLSSIKINQLPTHKQAIYTSRLLNPFTKSLTKYDNIDNNTVEIIDFTNL